MMFFKSNPDADPDVVEDTPTGAISEIILDHLNKFRHLIILERLKSIDPGSSELVFELRRASDGVWEQGATAYQHTVVETSLDTTVQGANFPVHISGVNQPFFGQYYLTSAGLAVPTKVVGVGWRETNVRTRCLSCVMTNIDLHDRARFRLLSGSVFDGVGKIITERAQ